jgi:hypothetical protein
MSIRDRVRDIAAEMIARKPTPLQLSEFEVALAGLLSHINDEACSAEIAFRSAVLDADAKTAAGKDQIAKAGPTYKRLLEAQATQKSCDQMLKTCRSAIRLRTEELRMTR